MEAIIAIIGCGRIARRHAQQAKKYGRLIAVCDIVAEKAASFAAEYGANAYTSLTEMLEKEPLINILSVCTPNGLHAEQTIEGLNTGKHVLCEKPMCLSEADGRKMINAVGNNRLFIVKSARYNPLLMQLKEVIREKTLGKIFSFHLNCSWNRTEAYYKDGWRGTLDMDGGTLFTQFSHYIDIMLWLFGDCRQMKGYRKNLHHSDIIEFEDTGVISLEMENCSVGSIHYSVNAFYKNQEISLNILAENGTLKLGGEYLNKVIYEEPGIFKEAAEATEAANDYGFYRGSMSNHDKVYEHMIRALNGQDHHITDGPEAMRTVAFIEEFYKNTPVT